ncbi:spore coat protein U domain-containing protein [Sphingomonas sinipercae]|uniref:Spore coat protein U domain-containing protein n=2 Tax=Sphingomonas sinipercae TaxID=2714944 RepID=A0A6G7ZQH5_9SPHN|nr:spore coat protein U domain-containing protein [Sphingomonas sinipercae]
MMRSVVCFACAAKCLFGAGVASAAPACGLQSVGVNFGAYSPLSGSSTDGVGQIRVSCDASTTYTIRLESGGNPSARGMTGGSDVLQYQLYTDAGRFTAWGDGAAGTSTMVSDQVHGIFPVYGRIPGGQNVRPGTYTDTIVVTLGF